ncbi:hypothetical protein F5148DRAFT_510023 [Russula earlei]|uniref:Uncharacterized protein n=1 Tax=Russula earlei TaxID=71964 RepID=A0ACC0UGV4_9AGAM|nr:hypothetical protein F5148DRAFT_510023 [Russula earlei]
MSMCDRGPELRSNDRRYFIGHDHKLVVFCPRLTHRTASPGDSENKGPRQSSSHRRFPTRCMPPAYGHHLDWNRRKTMTVRIGDSHGIVLPVVWEHALLVSDPNFQFLNSSSSIDFSICLACSCKRACMRCRSCNLAAIRNSLLQGPRDMRSPDPTLPSITFVLSQVKPAMTRNSKRRNRFGVRRTKASQAFGPHPPRCPPRLDKIVVPSPIGSEPSSIARSTSSMASGGSSARQRTQTITTFAQDVYYALRCAAGGVVCKRAHHSTRAIN